VIKNLTVEKVPRDFNPSFTGLRVRSYWEKTFHWSSIRNTLNGQDMETLNNSSHEPPKAKVSIGLFIPPPHSAVMRDWIDVEKEFFTGSISCKESCPGTRSRANSPNFSVRKARESLHGIPVAFISGIITPLKLLPNCWHPLWSKSSHTG